MAQPFPNIALTVRSHSAGRPFRQSWGREMTTVGCNGLQAELRPVRNSRHGTSSSWAWAAVWLTSSASWHLKEDKQAGSGGRNWIITLLQRKDNFPGRLYSSSWYHHHSSESGFPENCGASSLSQSWSFQGLDSKCFSESLQPSLKISVFPEEALLEQKV